MKHIITVLYAPLAPHPWTCGANIKQLIMTKSIRAPIWASFVTQSFCRVNWLRFRGLGRQGVGLTGLYLCRMVFFCAKYATHILSKNVCTISCDQKWVVVTDDVHYLYPDRKKKVDSSLFFPLSKIGRLCISYCRLPDFSLPFSKKGRLRAPKKRKIATNLPFLEKG